MTKRRKMHGKVSKVMKPKYPGQPEMAQIEIKEAEDLYREVRIENEVVDEHGETAALKTGADVDVIVEADSDATMKKPVNPARSED